MELMRRIRPTRRAVLKGAAASLALPYLPRAVAHALEQGCAPTPCMDHAPDLVRAITAHSLRNYGGMVDERVIREGTQKYLEAPHEEHDLETLIAGIGPLRLRPGTGVAPPPSGAVTIVDGGGNSLAFQIDAVNHWPDGSVRKGELSAITAQSISSGGFDTLSIKVGSTTITTRAANNVGGSTIAAGQPFRTGVFFKRGDVASGSTWSNTLPAGKTASQLMTDLQSFSGSQNLQLIHKSVASCTGASNVYTTGDWTFNINQMWAGTAIGGSFTHVNNMGPCCLGIDVWGQPNDGTRAHAHLNDRGYVWLWLNPSTGAITAVEYTFKIHNGLITTNIDNSAPYSSFPPDRYNYNPSIQNGATVIVDNTDATMLVHTGTPSSYGGHHARSEWLTARADGRTRWISNGAPNDNLRVTRDPIQANPQTIITARQYVIDAGALPSYNIGGTDSSKDPTTSYSPFFKGIVNGGVFGYSDTMNQNTGGEGANPAVISGDAINNFYLQDDDTALVMRLNIIGYGTYPWRFYDVTGRVPNVSGVSITGLAPTRDDSFVWATFNTEQGGSPLGGNGYSSGGWNVPTGPDTTHYLNHWYYPYLTEGGAHFRDLAASQANLPLWNYADYDYNMAHGNLGFPYYQDINRAPTIGADKFRCNTGCSYNIEREESWATREGFFAYALMPEKLADGTDFGEYKLYQITAANTAAFAAQGPLTFMLPGQVAQGNQSCVGGWQVAGAYHYPTCGAPSQLPWQEAYIGQVWAMAYLLHNGDATLGANGTTLGSNLTAMRDFNRTFFEQFANKRCSILLSSQWDNFKKSIDPAVDDFRSWDTGNNNEVGFWTGSNGVGVSMLDTVNGWCSMVDLANFEIVRGTITAGATTILVDPNQGVMVSGSNAPYSVVLTLDDGTWWPVSITADETSSGGHGQLTFSPAVPAGRSVLDGSVVYDIAGRYAVGVQLDVGALVSFTINFFTDWRLSPQPAYPPPSPFVLETTYRIVTIDQANKRFKLCLDSDMTNTVLIPSAPTTLEPGFRIPMLIATVGPTCPTSYLDRNGSTPYPTIWNDGYQLPVAQMFEVLCALSTYRRGGDTPDAATAWTAAVARKNILVSAVGPSARTFFSTLSRNDITYP
jgi:hypothetical protein